MTTVESGIGFYVGDVCYVLSDEVYHGFWGDQKHFKDGTFEVPGRNLSFAVGSTAYGDGLFFDDESYQYPVDAGVIGVVPLELVEKEEGLESGTVVRIPGKAQFECVAGEFTIKMPDGHSIHIVTDD